MNSPKNIIVINVTRIGDTLLTTPVLRALAKAWPTAKLTFLGHRKRIEVLRHLPFIHRLGTISKTLAPFLGYAGGERFDVALVYGNDAPLIKYALRIADRVIAFRQSSSELNSRLFAIAREDGFQPSHAVTLALTLIRPLRIATDGFYLSYVVTPEEDVWAKNELASRQVVGNPLIGLQVASFPTKSHRDWPIESFIDLCQRILHENPRTHFLIFGGAEERDRVHRLHASFASCSTVLAGRLSLRQTGAIMNQVDCYIGVDTGPTHIMATRRKPMVSMYHPTAPSSALGPLEHPCCFVIDHPIAEGGLPFPANGATFDTPMADIPVGAVLDSVRAALDGKCPRPLPNPDFPMPWLGDQSATALEPGVPT
jgi:heptosyltransferase-3